MAFRVKGLCGPSQWVATQERQPLATCGQIITYPAAARRGLCAPATTHPPGFLKLRFVQRNIICNYDLGQTTAANYLDRRSRVFLALPNSSASAPMMAR